MNKDNLDVLEFNKWNKRILNIYWYVIMIVSFTEMILFYVDCKQVGYVDFNYLTRYVIKPVFLNLLILSVINMIYDEIKDKSKERLKSLSFTYYYHPMN